jgi:hypothetical protein
MKFEELYQEAVLWTCYLENYLRPERYLSLFWRGMSEKHLPRFDHLGKFFPFDEFYVRDAGGDDPRSVTNLRSLRKKLILPWIYRPRGERDHLLGKRVIAPSAGLFLRLDDKVQAKNLFHRLGVQTPRWGFSLIGDQVLEKPIRDSAGGVAIHFTRGKIARDGFFLEEYLPGCASLGLQFFIHDQTELICADQMLYAQGETPEFVFSGQRNISREALPVSLAEDGFRIVEYLKQLGYQGLVGLDVLVGENGHFFLEINPRGIAFLPAHFAAVSRGWTAFMTCQIEGEADPQDLILLEFGRCKKVVRRLDPEKRELPGPAGPTGWPAGIRP